MRVNKIISGIAAFMVFLTAVLPISAASYPDVDQHWAAEAISRWSDREILQGDDRGFRPDDDITRAETAAVLDRVIGYTEQAENTFQDIPAGVWYEAAVLKLNQAGVMNGDGEGGMRPAAAISREEAIVMFARAFGIPQQGTAAGYSDAAEISSWAQGAVSQMTQCGYIQGDSGMLRPKDAVTRAEVVTILDQMVGLYLTEAGSYEGNYGRKLAVIKAGNVELSRGVLGGAVISPLVGSGQVTLTSTQLNGTLLNLAPGANIINNGSIIQETTSGKKDHTASNPNFIGGGNGAGGVSSVYSVSYHANGGSWGSSSVRKISYNRNAKLSSKAPSDPEWDGHIFMGWYESQSAANNLKEADLVNLSGTVTKNRSLYAGWYDRNSPSPSPTTAPETVTVKFVSGGGSASEQTVVKGQKAVETEPPVREGFEFDGWYYGVEADARAFLWSDAFEQDTTLYARWTVSEQHADEVAGLEAGTTENVSDTTVYPPAALPGEKVMVSVVPGVGYSASKPAITYLNSQGAMITIPDTEITQNQDGSYSFTVPEEAKGAQFTVTPVVEKTKYSVTIEASEHGTVTADQLTAVMDQEVTLTVVPEHGYSLKLLTVKSGETVLYEETELVSSQFKFQMPPSEVTVAAEFDELSFLPPEDWADPNNQTMVLPNNGVYEISSGYELAWAAAQVNQGELAGAKLKLTSDIDLMNYAWTPIGTAEHPFSGVLDGNGKAITNLKIEKEVTLEEADQAAYFAFFGVIRGTAAQKAEIKNLQLSGTVNNQTDFGAYAQADDRGRYTALLAAEAAYTDITGVTVSGSVTSECKTVGGLVAKLVVPAEQDGTVTISDCVNQAAVNGMYQTGGVIAYIRASSEKGTVEVLRCENKGQITSDKNVGGVIGLANRVNVSECKNTGSVTAAAAGSAGGVVGSFASGNQGFFIENCYNTAAVSAASGSAGGIVAEDATGNMIVRFCYNAGTITTTNMKDGRTTSAGIYGSTCGTFSTNLKNNYYLLGSAEYGACSGYKPSTETGAVITGQPDTPGQFEARAAVQMKAIGGWLNDSSTAADAKWRNAPDGVNSGYPILAWENGEAEIPAVPAVVTDDDSFRAALENSGIRYIVVDESITLKNGVYGPADSAGRKLVELKGALSLPADCTITIQNLDFATPGKQIITNMILSDAKRNKTFTFQNNTVTGAFACVLPDFLSGTVTIKDNVFTDTYTTDGGFTGDIVNNTGLTTRKHTGTFVVTGNTFRGYGAAVTYDVDPAQINFTKNQFYENSTDVLPVGDGVVDARYNYFQDGIPSLNIAWAVYEPFYTDPECTALSERVNGGKAYLISKTSGQEKARISQLSGSRKLYLSSGQTCDIEVIPFDARDAVKINQTAASTASVTTTGEVSITVGETAYTIPVVEPIAVDADIYLASTLEGLAQADPISFVPPEDPSANYLAYEAAIDIPEAEYLYLKIDPVEDLSVDAVSMQNAKGNFAFECENNIAKIPYELANAPFVDSDAINMTLKGGDKTALYVIQFTNTAADVTPIAYDFSACAGTYQPKEALANGSDIEIKEVGGVLKGGLTDELTMAGVRPELSALSSMSSVYDKDGQLKYQQFKVGYTGNCYLRPGEEPGTLVVTDADVTFRKNMDETILTFTGLIPKGTVYVKSSN